MTDSLIYLAETEDRTAFVSSIMQKFREDFTKDQPLKVLVKPNIVSREPYPTTTHPQVLAAVLDFLLDRGSRVTVADGPAVDAGNSDHIISNHPLAAVCHQRGLELLNLHKQGFARVKARSMSLEISTLALDCDCIISLPVLKAHQHCRMTGALKNQFGFLRNRERVMMHGKLKSLAKGIAEVNCVARPRLFIMDAVETYAHANEKRHGGIQRRLGYMLAGTDPVALDCLGLELLQRIDPGLAEMGPSDVPHLDHASRLGLGNMAYIIETVTG